MSFLHCQIGLSGIGVRVLRFNLKSCVTCVLLWQGKGGQSCSERQRKLCIAVLHYFAAEVPRGSDIIQQPGPSREPSTAAELHKEAASCPAEKHVLVHRIAAALATISCDSLHQVQCLPSPSWAESFLGELLG